MCRRIRNDEIAVHTTLLPGPSDKLLPFCLLLESDCGIGGGAIPLSDSGLDRSEGVVGIGVDDSGAAERDETCDVVVA